MAFMSSSNNNNSSTNGAHYSTAQAVNTANGVSTANTQVNSSNIDNLSDVVICTFLASQPNNPQLNISRKLTINGKINVALIVQSGVLQLPKKGHFAKECRALRNQDYKNKESTRRTVHVETSTSIALVSCDGLGGYDWSDQANEGPNYALMAYSS
ncbi:hypothetical protein Tco_0867336 [Tanacetum coccineum]